ncbi:HAD family hydrolase [Streptomyces sp. NBC_00210]|uniref:HAD family hydrolase n=1 Tax=Streptomyces sp. NBC_00210 TaxID=2903636 RepID=UPI00325562A6
MQPLVLFDLDNTLVDRRLALTDWAAAFRARFGLRPEDEIWLISQLAERASPAHFAEIRGRFHLVESASVLWDSYCAAIAATVTCHPDVLMGLERLRALGWRIGIATNGATDIQWAKLHASGVADRTDAVCISGEVGARKPEPAMFLEAVRRCGGRDDVVEAWMVGDNPVNDIGGGQAVGLRTVWISRGVTWPRSCPSPIVRSPEARLAIDLLVAREPKRSTA